MNSKDIQKQISKAIDNFLNDPWKYTEDHRYGISDVEWAKMQPKEQNYFVGDVVEFKVGGVGIINDVSKKEYSGWPPQYSTDSIKGYKYRKDGKVAWHYDGDFKRLIAPSALRSLNKKGNKND